MVAVSKHLCFSFGEPTVTGSFLLVQDRLLGKCIPHGLLTKWEFPKIRVPYFGVLIIRILLFRVLY